MWRVALAGVVVAVFAGSHASHPLAQPSVPARANRPPRPAVKSKTTPTVAQKPRRPPRRIQRAIASGAGGMITGGAATAITGLVVFTTGVILANAAPWTVAGTIGLIGFVPFGGAAALVGVPVLVAGVLRRRLSRDPRPRGTFQLLGAMLVLGGVAINVGAGVLFGSPNSVGTSAPVVLFTGLLSMFIGGALIGEGSRATTLSTRPPIDPRPAPADPSHHNRSAQTLVPKTTSFTVLRLAW